MQLSFASVTHKLLTLAGVDHSAPTNPEPVQTQVAVSPILDLIGKQNWYRNKSKSLQNVGTIAGIIPLKTIEDRTVLTEALSDCGLQVDYFTTEKDDTKFGEEGVDMLLVSHLEYYAASQLQAGKAAARIIQTIGDFEVVEAQPWQLLPRYYYLPAVNLIPNKDGLIKAMTNLEIPGAKEIPRESDPSQTKLLVPFTTSYKTMRIGASIERQLRYKAAHEGRADQLIKRDHEL